MSGLKPRPISEAKTTAIAIVSSEPFRFARHYLVPFLAYAARERSFKRFRLYFYSKEPRHENMFLFFFVVTDLLSVVCACMEDLQGLTAVLQEPVVDHKSGPEGPSISGIGFRGPGGPCSLRGSLASLALAETRFSGFTQKYPVNAGMKSTLYLVPDNHCAVSSIRARVARFRNSIDLIYEETP
jgi:hypothetical protein